VCHFIHGAADAALLLREEVPDLEAIRNIRILLPGPTLPIVAGPVADKARPQTDYAAKFSAPFVIATCLVRGRFGLAELESAALADPQVLALCARSRCEVDPDTAFPTYFSGGVEVELADGRRLRRHIRVNSGAGERALDAAGASAKFLAAASMHLSPAAAQRACEAVLAIDTKPLRETTPALVVG
jgi:2-methylcitrate dehydratase PrpD